METGILVSLPPIRAHQQRRGRLASRPQQQGTAGESHSIQTNSPAARPGQARRRPYDFGQRKEAMSVSEEKV